MHINTKTRLDVWSYGGGTQSVAIAALILQGRIRQPEFAVISDTGMEKGSTWSYLESVVNPALSKIGLQIDRVQRNDWETPWSQGAVNGCFAAKGDIMIPVFTSENGINGKLSGFCSSAWKKEVITRWLSKTHGLTASRVRKWLGFSTDEPRRFTRYIDDDSVFLPLVCGVALSRSQCVELVKKAGWPDPPRSSCWMCPNQKNDEWLETKRNRQDEFEKAILLERRVREIDPETWFHPQRVPLDQVDWSTSKVEKGQRACNSGECFL